MFTDMLEHQSYQVRSLCFNFQNPFKAARVKPFLKRSRNKPIILEKIFFHLERGIALLQVSRFVSGYPMPQNQILRPGRSTNRVCLYVLELIDGAL